METLAAIAGRASATKLIEPGPTEEHLAVILNAATRAPDHGRLSPWRFLVHAGDARQGLGTALGRSLARRDPSATAEVQEREAAKVLRAPLIVTVVAAIQPGKIPEVEQILAVGAGVQNMLLAAHALGYGAMWKTGAPAYDSELKAELGFAASDQIVAFLYLGTQAGTLGPREIDAQALTRRA